MSQFGNVGRGPAFPVSVKGVAVQYGQVLLLENERAEWELPGGKLELGEDPQECVAREIREETGPADATSAGRRSGERIARSKASGRAQGAAGHGGGAQAASRGRDRDGNPRGAVSGGRTK